MESKPEDISEAIVALAKRMAQEHPMRDAPTEADLGEDGMVYVSYADTGELICVMPLESYEKLKADAQ